MARRPLLAGFATAGALATALLALGLTGAGPWSGGEDGAKAKETCISVPMRVNRRVPVIVEGRLGTPVVRYRMQPVVRHVRRCR